MVIAGDLTDAKDYHSAQLVRRVVDNILLVRRSLGNGGRVEILMGNHDYLKRGHAFFAFLSQFEGVRFITEPCDDGLLEGPLALFLPHTKTPVADWSGMDLSHYSYVFMHQTAPGSVASNGQKMDGETLPSLKGPKVYSGDIHVPQAIGDIEYIGSPYHVHFGDRFKPRAVFIDRRGRPDDMHFETISRMTLKVDSLRALKRQQLRAGDQIKLRVQLSASEKHEWLRIKREAIEWLKQQQVELHDIELLVERSTRRLIAGTRPAPVLGPVDETDAVLRHVTAEGLGADALEMGLELL